MEPFEQSYVMPEWLEKGLKNAFISRDIKFIKAYQQLLIELLND